MELQEKRALELKQASFALTSKPLWSAVGNVETGIGTCISPYLILTTLHIAKINGGGPIYAWDPSASNRTAYPVALYWYDGQNAVLRSQQKLPCTPLPLPDSSIDSLVKPGATVVYQDGYSTYDIKAMNNILIATGTFEGHTRVGATEIAVEGPVGGGTSGAAFYSVEDGIIVGVEYGFITKSKGTYIMQGEPATMIGYVTDSYGKKLNLSTVRGTANSPTTNPQASVATPFSTSKTLPEQLKTALIIGGTTIAAGLIVKEFVS